MLLESQYQKQLIQKIKDQYPGAVVLKNDSSYIQGIPDWLVLHGPHWAALEIKRSAKARHQPNQPHYIRKLDRMSFAAFVYPENEGEILNEIHKTLQLGR